MQITRPTGNRLLDLLDDDEFARLSLVEVELAFRQQIERANMPIEAVYFPLTGMISVVAASGAREIEVGLIGCEGMSGTAVTLGADQSPNEVYVQVEGFAFRMSADELRNAMKESPRLRGLFLLYSQVFAIQTAQTALSNGRSIIEERLARWLLMAQDRLQRSELPLTHELLSIMLGVRRPGVTDALNALEGVGLIKASRGRVKVIDRAGIEARANGCYGIPEAEYRRLIEVRVPAA